MESSQPIWANAIENLLIDLEDNASSMTDDKYRVSGFSRWVRKMSRV